MLQTAKAENPDTITVYLTKAGKKAITKDSSDYYRIILPPDSNIDKDLYRVYEYYPDGSRKTIATSFTKSGNLVFDGTSITFFNNGKRCSTVQFKNGRPKGPLTFYYPNGALYSIFKFDDLSNGYYDGYYNNFLSNSNYNYRLNVVELRDSTGKVLAIKGTGHVLIFDDDFKKVTIEGDIHNYKKEGEWKGLIADSGTYTCIYHRDELKSGISYMKSGNHYTFKEMATNAVFSDGLAAFQTFIKRNLQYPESAKKHKATGTVVVGFCVETNGTVSDVKILKGVIKSLDEEALRVISLSPLWIPASNYGVPLRSYGSVRVDFYYNM